MTTIPKWQQKLLAQAALLEQEAQGLRTAVAFMQRQITATATASFPRKLKAAVRLTSPNGKQKSIQETLAIVQQALANGPQHSRDLGRLIRKHRPSTKNPTSTLTSWAKSGKLQKRGKGRTAAYRLPAKASEPAAP